jgi:hypothetical protein
MEAAAVVAALPASPEACAVADSGNEGGQRQHRADQKTVCVFHVNSLFNGVEDFSAYFFTTVTCPFMPAS